MKSRTNRKNRMWKRAALYEKSYKPAESHVEAGYIVRKIVQKGGDRLAQIRICTKNRTNRQSHQGKAESPASPSANSLSLVPRDRCSSSAMPSTATVPLQFVCYAEQRNRAAAVRLLCRAAQPCRCSLSAMPSTATVPLQFVRMLSTATRRRGYNSSAMPSSAMPIRTNTMTAYCVLLSFSLRKMRDNRIEKML